MSLLTQLLVLTPQPDQFVAFGRCDELSLLRMAPIPSIGCADPVADRLRGWFELSREIIRIAADADQFNHLSTKFRRVMRTGFGHVGSLRRKCGGLRQTGSTSGSRPPMVRDNRHDSAYIFGAICPARAVGAAIIAPVANIECMNLHLQEISTQLTPGSIAALVCDSAGWHQTGGELELPNNIVLLPLTPYSPELNPMENVWGYLRGNKLSARVWDSYEAIVEACAEARNFFVNDPDRIRSSGIRDWATVNL